MVAENYPWIGVTSLSILGHERVPVVRVVRLVCFPRVALVALVFYKYVMAASQ